MTRASAIAALALLCCASLPHDIAEAQGRGRRQVQTAPGAVRPAARPCAGGEATEVFHVYSECNPRDRLWHVVTDQEYLCRNPDGSTHAQTVRVSDRATTDRCDDQPIDPNAPRTRNVVGRDLPQVQFEDRATFIGIITIRECINGFWTPVEYQTFRAEDGRTVIDRNRPTILDPTSEPCQPQNTQRADARLPGATGQAVAQGAVTSPILTLEPVGGARNQSALAVGPVFNIATLASAANAITVGNNLLSPSQRIAAGEPPEDILSESDEVTVIADTAPVPRPGVGAAITALFDLVRGRRVHAAQSAPVQILFTSLGGSTGDILQMQVFKTGTGPVRLQGLDVVLEPLQDAGAAQVRREIQNRGLKAARTIRMTGYCVEFLKAPPAAGALFRVAPADVQQQFAPMRSIMASARRAYKGGRLNPDSEATEYFHSIRQWALWTFEQRLDEQAFTKRFIEHARKNLEGAGRPWSRELEGAIRAIAPNRWRDVTTVLRTARPGGANAR